METKTESILYNRIIQLLQAYGWPAWRGQSGGRIYKGRKVRQQDNGRPDIECILPPYGTLIGIEVKRPGERQSLTQVAWQELLVQHGGRYYVVTSVDDVQEIIETKLLPWVQGPGRAI